MLGLTGGLDLKGSGAEGTLPDPETSDTKRLQWMQEIHSLEAKGIR